MKRIRDNENGVVLIALLWILVALSILAMSFARETFVEVAVARNTRELSEAYFVARAGIEVTVYELWRKRTTPRVRRLELATAPDPIDLGKVMGRIGNGIYEVEIQDESGKVSLNNANEEQLKRLMEVVGIEQPDSAVIVDSILDWRDVDRLHRFSGAEDDYYMSLETPYKAKNGRFDTVEELLLVRGINRQYYYGFRERGPDGEVLDRFGLSRYLTVYTNSARININFAPIPVLLSIPGMTPEAAQMIYERRQVQPFENVAEITRVLPVNLATTAQRLISTAQTGTYTLTAAAHLENSKITRVIRAVIRLEVREPKRYTIMYWNESIANL